MTLAIAVLGLLVLALGALGVARPRSLMTLVERPWRSRAGLYVAVAFRAVVGVLLLAAASGTRFPWIVGAIGVLSVAAAVTLPVLGYERLRKQVDWWMARPDGFVRGWSVAACLFGAFLVLAAV
jgi:hypothetical protein